MEVSLILLMYVGLVRIFLIGGFSIIFFFLHFKCWYYEGLSGVFLNEIEYYGLNVKGHTLKAHLFIVKSYAK